jgi:hypothetical protein
VNSLLTRTAAALLTVVAAATFIAGSSSTATATAASGLVPVGAAEVAALDADHGVPEVGYRLGRTPEQRAEWAALTATPESRKQLVGDLREAFAGIAQVHVQESPSSVAPAASRISPTATTGTSGSPSVTPTRPTV